MFVQPVSPRDGRRRARAGVRQRPHAAIVQVDVRSRQPHVRQDFIHRSDEVIQFHSLDVTHLKQIVEIQLAGLRKRLEERHITLDLTDAARAHLVQVGYDPAYGARPLKRAIQREVETALAKRILSGEVRDGMAVHVDVRGGALSFEPVQATVAFG